jgi:hypothetical protein
VDAADDANDPEEEVTPPPPPKKTKTTPKATKKKADAATPVTAKEPKPKKEKAPAKYVLLVGIIGKNDTIRRPQARDKGFYVPPETHVTS